MRQVVTEIVEEVLGRRDIDPAQDLFDQGATSLVFVRIIATVNDRCGTALTGSELGDTASIDTLTAAVRAAEEPVPTPDRSAA